MRAILFRTYWIAQHCTNCISSGSFLRFCSIFDFQLTISTHSFAASVILHVVYGTTTPTSLNDPFLLQLQKMIPRVQSAMMPGAYLVDKYPILKYIPGYGRNLRAWGQEEYKMLSGKLNWVKSQVVRTLPLYNSHLHRPRHDLTTGKQHCR